MAALKLNKVARTLPPGIPVRALSTAVMGNASLPTQKTQICRSKFPSPTPSASTTSTSRSGLQQKCEWLVILPDQPGAYKRRVNLRPQHLAELSKYPADFWLCGGRLLEEPPPSKTNDDKNNNVITVTDIEENDQLKALGSALIAWGSSKEEVLAELRKDIYSANDVWDWDMVQVFPFKSTLRKAM